MEIDSKKTAALKWRCRRGMRELDKMTEAYLEHCYAKAGEQEQRVFAQLLELPDPELLALLLRRKEAMDEVTELVLERMRQGH